MEIFEDHNYIRGSFKMAFRSRKYWRIRSVHQRNRKIGEFAELP